MTPVALSPLNPAARIRNSQTDPDLRVKRGKFYKITGHLRNYTFHGMLVVAFHRSFRRHFPSFHSPSPLCCSNPLEYLSTILFIIESPSLPKNKNEKEDRPLRSSKLYLMEIPHALKLLSCSSTIISSLSFHFSKRLKRAFQLAQNEDSRS